jgi:hypothetical protein
MKTSLIIIAYHHIDDRFRSQLPILRACGRLVSLNEGLERLQTSGSGRMLALTFDDFYEQVYHYIHIEKLNDNVPVSAFMATKYATGGMPFWWDRVSLILDQTRADQLVWKGQTYPLSSASARQRIAYFIRADLRLRHTDEIDHSVNSLQRALGCDSVAAPDSQRPASWPQVVEMAKAGIEIGSHTISHPALSALSESDLVHELQQSKELLEERTSRPVAGIAYPFGGTEHFNERVCVLARTTGYRYGLTCVEGINRPGTNPFRLSRYLLGMDEGPLRVFIKASGLGPFMSPARNIWRWFRSRAAQTRLR